MADERFGGLGRGVDAAAVEFNRDCAAALRHLRAARGVFTLLLLLSLLVNLGVFVAIYRFDLLSWRAAHAQGYTPMSVSALGPDTPEAKLERALAVTRVVAYVAAVLLVITFLLASQATLAARVPGAAGSLSAAMWMLLVLVLLAPWQQWVPGAGNWTAFVDLSDAQQLTEPDVAQKLADWFVYVQHGLYPLIVLAATCVAWMRFSVADAVARRQLLTRTDVRSV
ncbi:MAG TPA: hypothetical protein VGM03_02140 [Phycisphaerae bacterium]|jgi:hypothetical protein